MIPMIKSFKVGGMEFDVELLDDEIREGNTILFGSANHVTNIVSLSRKISGEMVANDVLQVTLYHEILHILFNVCGFNLEKDQEEEMVDRLSYMLYEFEQTKKYYEKGELRTQEQDISKVGFKMSYEGDAEEES